MQLNTQNNKQKKHTDSLRKMRTRTLIQLGGLIEKSGMTAFFNIELGEDLQADLDQYDKAATLLGFLSETLEEFDENKLNEWTRIGIRIMKQKI